MEEMKKNIRRVFWLYFLMFALAVGFLVRFVIVDSHEMIGNTYNPRIEKVNDEILRGEILDANGDVLAKSTLNEKGGFTRVYPGGRQFSHIVGYDQFGKSGVEAKYNFDLQTLSMETLQRAKKVISHEPLVANSIVLTIDGDLQRLAYELLNGQKGAIVVTEPSTGKILAMVSYPDFDPNTLGEDWEHLRDDSENSPFLNRATQGLYPPGSVFKILTATAFMESTPDFWNFTFDCVGEFIYGSNRIRCFDSTVHGHEDITKAFAYSCNSFFASAGINCGPNKLREVAHRFLFDGEYPFPLDYKVSSFPLGESASDSETMETAIGQGRILTTPLQMALVTSAVANGGIMMAPYIVDHSLTPGGEIVNKHFPEKLATPITAEQADFLTGMMVETVTSGTGMRAQIQGVSVAAKTGTAENSSGNDHGWFVAFAPAEKPRVAVSIVLENSGGPRAAQGMAREIISRAISSN